MTLKLKALLDTLNSDTVAKQDFLPTTFRDRVDHYRIFVMSVDHTQLQTCILKIFSSVYSLKNYRFFFVARLPCPFFGGPLPLLAIHTVIQM